MFPSNLHKNIIQLDRQISLLEDECKNMEAENRKKLSKPEPFHNKSSRASNLQVTQPVKVALKKSSVESSKRTKKLAPSFSARVHSSSSLQSNCSKPWSEINEALASKKIKQRGMNTNSHAYACQKPKISNSNNPKKLNKCTNCICCSEDSLIDLPKKNIETSSSNIDENCKDQILHKEVLFSKPGGRIEVTVTQKSSVDEAKENSSLKKKNSVNNAPEKDVSSCPCMWKGQKWSEILSLEPVKQKTKDFSRNSANSALPDEGLITQPINHCSLSKTFNGEAPSENQNKSPRKENYDVPVKLTQQPQQITKQASQRKRSKPEKETQCHLEVNESKESETQFSKHDPIQFFQFLMKELEQKPSEEKKKLLKDMEYVIMKLSHNGPPGLFKKLLDDNKNDILLEPLKLKTDFQNAVRQHCENLMKEKELLSKELSAKESTISTMQRREEEYLSLISTLKSNLEKVKMNSQDGINALKELNSIKNKFLEQAKISEALKKSLSRMQDIMERCALENDKLKTQIQIFRLEAQKNDVLLAGKEAEIKRYKEEIKNFQRQISDHLASLKSNAQSIDVQRMMEAIFEQTQVFVHKDVDDSSRPNNGLMHSSPTSTKTSVVNSSWKRISSIRHNDHIVENAEVFTEMSDINDKEFIPVFGDDSSSESSKKSEMSMRKKPVENQGKIKHSSFPSFFSIRDDDDCGYSSISKNEGVSGNEKPVSPAEKKALMSKKVQKNIDELLQNMKLKWSKEVRGTSPDNFSIDDFLNSSQISSISVVSENVAFPDSPK